MIDREQADKVVRAIKDLIRSVIADQSDTEPDSMGSYYEEQALIDTILQELNPKP